MAELTTSWQSLGSATLYTGITIHLDAKYSTQSMTDNTSSVQFRLRSVGNNWRTTSGTAKFTGAYTDSESCATYPDYIENGETIYSISKTIKHADDGTKSLSIGGSVQAYINGNSRTATISNKAVTLPKINRLATMLSASDFTDEDNPSFDFNNLGGFTVKPWLVFKDDNDVNVYSISRSENISSPYTWELTNEERNSLWLATNKQQNYKVQIGIDTYNEGVKLGNSFLEKTMNYVNAEPTYTYSIVDENDKVTNLLGSSSEYLVQNVSEPKITINPITKKNATVSSVILSYNGVSSIIKTSPYEKKYIADSSDFLVRVYDSRLFPLSTGQDTISKEVIEYIPINVDSFSFKRENPTSSNIILNAQIRYKQTSFDSVDNVPTIKWKMGENGTLTTLATSDYSIDTENNKITISNLILSNVLPYTSEGRFYLYVNDLLTEDAENEVVLRGIPTCDMGEHDFQVNGELFVADENRNNKKEIRDLIYPVGSIYMSINNTNPSTLFGGTWEQLKDRFLLGSGDTYSNGDTGGSATVTLTTAQMPKHSHYHNPNDTNGIMGTFTSGSSTRSRCASGSNGGYTYQDDTQSNLSWGKNYTADAGSGNAHENMPPYLVVYMWKRTG